MGLEQVKEQSNREKEEKEALPLHTGMYPPPHMTCILILI